MEWGETTFLEHLSATIVTVTDSEITCIGAQNAQGGRNIDYFIISTSLLGSRFQCTTDFAIPWAPHYGICLELAADPGIVVNCVLQKPDMPKKIDEIVKGNLEENSFQKKPKLENKLKQKEIADGKKAELILRETNDAKMFESIFQKTANENFDLEAGGEIGEHIRTHYERLTGEATTNANYPKTWPYGLSQSRTSGTINVKRTLAKQRTFSDIYRKPKQNPP